MGYDLITNVESCHIQLPVLLYYSHWPSIIISLFFGLFVFFKSDRSLVGKILLSISIAFSLWAGSNLIVWITFDSVIYSFFWSFFETLSILFYFLVLYFGYVFIEEKDISFKFKFIFLVLFFPVAIISSTKHYLVGFDAATCDAIMNDKFIYFIYILKGIAFLGTLVLLLVKYIKYQKDKIKKSKITLVGIALIFLLLSFLATQYIGDLISNNYYQIEFYGLFAVNIFVGFLVYLIVKYRAFNIKLIGAQALVYALVILIGSQFFFITSSTNRILTGITLALAVGFGVFLIKSVKEEVQRKEELQDLTEKLAIANDELRKLDNAKSEFISIASHQLRTPLTSIKGYVSLILEGTYGVVEQRILDPLNKIYTSNERLIQLVEELLNVSRIESGRMEFMFEKCRIEKTINDLYDTFSVLAKNKGLYLHLELSKIQLPEIEIDPSKTREVISNLIDNALKYTKRGGVTIRTELLKNMDWKVKHVGGQDEKLYGDMVRITVSDTGMGVPDSELPYLFTKFSRGKDTSRLHVGGTGLGLYVGKNIIEAQHGRIYVESEGSEKGSKFIVELPIAQPKG